MTTLDDLHTLREVMADPSNVVNNPHAMEEFSDGPNEKVVRRCLVSHAYDLFDSSGAAVVGTIYRVMEANGDERSMGAVMADGDYLAVIDAAINAQEVAG